MSRGLNYQQNTLQQIVQNLPVGGFYTALLAGARPKIHQLRKPTFGAIVDCLGDVEPKIEAAVIAPSQHEHELSRLVLHLAQTQLRILLLEVVGVEQSRLVPQVLGTLREMLRKVASGLFLQNGGLISWDTVPEFRLTFMEKID